MAKEQSHITCNCGCFTLAALLVGLIVFAKWVFMNLASFVGTHP